MDLVQGLPTDSQHHTTGAICTTQWHSRHQYIRSDTVFQQLLSAVSARQNGILSILLHYTESAVSIIQQMQSAQHHDAVSINTSNTVFPQPIRQHHTAICTLQWNNQVYYYIVHILTIARQHHTAICTLQWYNQLYYYIVHILPIDRQLHTARTN